MSDFPKDKTDQSEKTQVRHRKKKHRNRLLFSTVSSLFSIKTRSRVLAVLEACFSRVGFSSASLLHIHRLYLFQKLLLVTWRQSAMVCGSNIRLLSLNKPGEVLCDRKLRGTVVQTSSANHVTVKLTRSYLNASFTTETSDSRSSSGRFCWRSAAPPCGRTLKLIL